jgi:hypothetical protein
MDVLGVLRTDDADVPVFRLHLCPTNPERRSGAGMRTAGTACSLGKVTRDSTAVCICLAPVCDGGDAFTECARSPALGYIEAASGAKHGLFAGHVSRVSSWEDDERGMDVERVALVRGC